MDLIKIKDIKIRYDDNQEIDYIKNVINNNYNLFAFHIYIEIHFSNSHDSLLDIFANYTS